MNVLAFEPLLKNATVKALDTVGKKLAGAEVTAENAITRLLSRWNALSKEEKENVATVIIATAATAVTAIVALKGGKKTTAKKMAKNVVRNVAKKIAR